MKIRFFAYLINFKTTKKKAFFFSFKVEGSLNITIKYCKNSIKKVWTPSHLNNNK